MHEGLNWKLKRIKAGLRAKDISIITGISQPAISFFESGQRNMPPEKLQEYQRVIIEELERVIG